MSILLSLALAGCAKHAPSNAADYVGAWEDEGGSVTTIDKSGRALEVTSIIDTDGEVFEVKGTGYVGGQLNWTYLVPSTGYVVTIRVLSLEGDQLCATWENAYDHGNECYTRVSW